MNVVYKHARLAIIMQICLLLVACGNKGNLYLEQVQLTDEQRELLDELEGLDGAESSLESDKDKKKKTLNKPDTTELKN